MRCRSWTRTVASYVAVAVIAVLMACSTSAQAPSRETSTNCLDLSKRAKQYLGKRVTVLGSHFWNHSQIGGGEVKRTDVYHCNDGMADWSGWFAVDADDAKVSEAAEKA